MEFQSQPQICTVQHAKLGILYLPPKRKIQKWSKRAPRKRAYKTAYDTTTYASTPFAGAAPATTTTSLARVYHRARRKWGTHGIHMLPTVLARRREPSLPGLNRCLATCTLLYYSFIQTEPSPCPSRRFLPSLRPWAPPVATRPSCLPATRARSRVPRR